MKKLIFSALAVLALVLSFTNLHTQQQASVSDPNPSVITPTQI